MIEPGRYKARATGAEMGFTNAGKEQIAIAFELTEQPGHRITWYGLFRTELVGQEKISQCQRSMEALRACGWKTDDLSDLAGITDNDVEITIDHETDQKGETRARVRWINAAGTGGPALKNVMPDAQKRSFAAKMKAAALASRAKMPAPSANGQQRPANAGDAWEPKDEDAPNW
jgi:hypothetical protein